MANINDPNRSVTDRALSGNAMGSASHFGRGERSRRDPVPRSPRRSSLRGRARVPLRAKP